MTPTPTVAAVPLRDLDTPRLLEALATVREVMPDLHEFRRYLALHKLTSEQLAAVKSSDLIPDPAHWEPDGLLPAE